MNPMKIIPIAATLGVLVVAGAKVFADMIEEEFGNKNTPDEPIKKETKKSKKIESKFDISSVSILIYTRALKKVQNELARAYEIKMLNERLEHTGVIEKIEIRLNGHIIEDFITELESNLDVYVNHLKKFRHA